MTKVAVALYDDDTVAQEVVNELRDAGIAQSDISVASHATTGSVAGDTGYGTTEGSLGRLGASGSLYDNLVDLGVPRDEAEIYAEGTRRGGSLVLVRADDAQAEEAAAIMDRRQIVDYESRSAAWRAEGWTGYEASASPYTADEAAAERQRHAELLESEAYAQEHRTAGETVAEGRLPGEGASPVRADEETTIPIVEEDIHVDKRTRRGKVRIHSFVEERPVEETVRLRDEEVTVERRAVDRPVSGAEAEGAFRETDVEVDEVHEEAVVSKEARVVEEVRVGKESREREEVVRDTVRRTDVEIDDKTLGKGKERP